MPWSPIPKFPDIINTLKDMGFEKEVTLEPLRKAVMMHTGVIKDQSIKTTIGAMETLEFLTKKSSGSVQIWYIGKPPQKSIEEEKEMLEKRMKELSGGGE